MSGLLRGEFSVERKGEERDEISYEDKAGGISLNFYDVVVIR